MPRGIVIGSDGLKLTLEFTEPIEVNLGDYVDVKTSHKRSLNANSYFWSLCDHISKKLCTTKDHIYEWMLTKAGVWEDIEVVDEAVDAIKNLYRYTEVLDHNTYIGEDLQSRETTILRCYKGTSTYNSKEMADLINETIYQANDIGIDTWCKEEIDALLADWRNNEK